MSKLDPMAEAPAGTCIHCGARPDCARPEHVLGGSYVASLPKTLTQSTDPAPFLSAVVAALPELQRQGVRRLVLGPLTLELDRVQIASDDAGYDPTREVDPGETLPPQPEPGESDDLDTAAVDG